MKKSLQNWLESQWYQSTSPTPWLMPLTVIFASIVRFRQFFYRTGLFKSIKLPIPVIVVGNLTVGGTGKSPLVLYLADVLCNANYKPGIISRGYGGKTSRSPQRVFPNSNPEIVGDEAVMLAIRANCPVVVCPVRSKAAQLLLTECNCNIIISDDGLQHYALQRDIEIAVVDGERRFGNGYSLPAGPLREPIDRLQTVDFIVVNGTPLAPSEYAMHVQGELAVNLKTAEEVPLHNFSGQPVHALAGIGNPQRFFNLLNALNIKHTQAVFPDHYQFQAADLEYKDDLPLLMTEKDAVKCRAFATRQYWYVPVRAELEPRFTQHLLNLLQEKRHGS